MAAQRSTSVFPPPLPSWTRRPRSLPSFGRTRHERAHPDRARPKPAELPRSRPLQCAPARPRVRASATVARGHDVSPDSRRGKKKPISPTSHLGCPRWGREPHPTSPFPPCVTRPAPPAREPATPPVSDGRPPARGGRKTGERAAAGSAGPQAERRFWLGGDGAQRYRDCLLCGPAGGESGTRGTCLAPRLEGCSSVRLRLLTAMAGGVSRPVAKGARRQTGRARTVCTLCVAVLGAVLSRWKRTASPTGLVEVSPSIRLLF